MAKTFTVRELATAIKAATATEYAVASEAARSITASGLARAVPVDSTTVAAPLRRDHSGIKGGPMAGCVVECVSGDVTFAIVPFVGTGSRYGRWLVLGDETAVGQAIHGLISNDCPGDPVKLVRRAVREIAKREAHLRAMC